MGLLNGYLMRTIIASTALVLLVLLALGALFEFIGQLEDVKGNYGIQQALIYTLLRLPQLSFAMLPIAVLIGALLGLGGLANNSELVVMRTAGLSIVRLSGMAVHCQAFRHGGNDGFCADDIHRPDRRVYRSTS